ncbi:hypothetical protein GF312_10480 [Candidatus Poribacteria bacterium]|nr:hypothetical protein [Candidatus Poribacteria bacterium]
MKANFKIINEGGIVIVIGRVDTGKSTFCRHLASEALKEGKNVAVIDSDVGQSWIGPPTTVAMKVYSENPKPILFPDSFYFVGSVTPERHLLQTVVGVRQVLDSALKAKVDLVVIDTTGLVDGRIGKVLKSSKIEAVRPNHIVCIQRDGELETLIKGYETDSTCNIYRISPAREVKKKSRESRCSYRIEKFCQYFSDFAVYEVSFSQINGQRISFLNGREANDKELENISKVIDHKVLYAEWSSKSLFAVTENEVNQASFRKLCGYFSLKELYTYTPGYFKKRLVAIIDRSGEPVCLALIEDIDFCRKILTLRGSKDATEVTRAIQFSSFRLDDLDLSY